MTAFAAWLLLFFVAVYIVRAVRGPSVWDRLLAMSLISVKLVLVVCLFASESETAYLLDFAIVCVLLGFISIIFTALFLFERIVRK